MKEEVVEEKPKTINVNDKIENEEKRKKVDKGVDAFILSIISVFSIFFWYICITASIYGLVRSILAVKRSGHNLAKSAYIISLISLTICIGIYSQIIVAIILFY